MPGRWEREIDEAERFYTALANNYKASGRMFFIITGFISVKTYTTGASSKENSDRMHEALRKAWLRLRYDHPTIASCIIFSPTRDKWIKRYTSLDNGNVSEQHDEWLDQTFHPIAPGVDGLTWCNADPPASAQPSLFVVTPPNDSSDDGSITQLDLVLRSPHDILDGIGTLHLLNNLINYMAQAYQEPTSLQASAVEDEGRNLSPPLRVAASVPPIMTLAQQESLEDIIANNAAIRQNIKVLTLPFKQGQDTPGKHQRVALQLSLRDTKQLIEASKALGATVTHLYHSAIAITLRDLQAPQDEESVGRYINYALINERPNCMGEYATSKHAVAVYHSVSENSLVLDLPIPSIEQIRSRELVNEHDVQKEFLEIVHKVKTYYHILRDSPDHLALMPSIWSMATPDIQQSSPADSSCPSIPAPNPAPSVSLSSMGVIDKIITPQRGPVKVDNPWVTGEELGTGFGMFLGTWEGRLSLSLAYNDAWHDKEEAEGFMERVHQVVWEGLGLDVKYDDVVT